MSQQLFERFGKLHNFFKEQHWLTRHVHALLEKWAPGYTKEDHQWEEEADMAMLEQAPLRAKKVLYWIAAVLIVLLVWSGVTQIDEVTRGEGRVIPSKQVQIVQSLDGGIVAELLVREGQTVKEGEPLVRIDQTRAVSSLRENRSQYLSLLAKQARLQALAGGGAFNPPQEVLKEAPDVASQEKALYVASNEELASSLAIAAEQVKQRERELAETRAKLEQAERGYELSSRELAVTKPLEASGAVSEVDLLRLERDTARFRGERDQARAQIGRVEAAISEARRKISETQQSFRSKVRSELSDTTAKLNAISEASVALSDKVKQSTLKSPVNGTVSRLFFNTVGGVIQPGKEVLELVPTDDALVLETKIQPKDIAFVSLNQRANVKLTAYDYTIYGTLEAKVQNISADSIVDDKGNAFYIVKVRTLKPNLGEGLPIIPGMVAQVDIITGKKSVLSYLLKPVLKAKAYAFTER
ncbi:MAG TPA: HlyD family type I secretion periplasmic adaptor subunit [Methylophilus sp.]|nr:HlyD family type I secretion periplasmic adaptor subunit [Methylophilus sp.]